MVQDLCFSVYKRQCTALADEENVESLISPKPAGKYRIAILDNAAPLPFAGYTVLAEPYPIDNCSTIKGLKSMQTVLANRISGFVPVPVETLHMTIADLVSGISGIQPAFEAQFPGLTGALQVSETERPIYGNIIGVGSFPRSSVVIAIVDFESAADYDRILDLRNRLYCGSLLYQNGTNTNSVTRGNPFQGHVTLGYLEGSSNGLNQALRFIRRNLRRSANGGGKVEVKRARLYWFNDMSNYYPTDYSLEL